ncbi:MAG: MoaD/ThiS family protein [Candidatus Binatia bacterium]
MMRVLLPTMLRSYSGGAAEVEGDGRTLAELLGDLDARYAGIRFRIIDEQDRVRQHVRIFVDGEAARELSVPLSSNSVVQVVGALSGG